MTHGGVVHRSWVQHVPYFCVILLVRLATHLGSNLSISSLLS